MHKLNLVLYAINNYLSDPDILYVSIHLDNEIVISTKQDLLTLLTYMDLPDHMIQEVEKSKPSLDEAMLGETHCPEKIMFMLSVQQFLDIILDPLIDRWKKAIEKSFNKVVIQSILNENLLFIDNKIEEYHRILADTHDKKQRKSIQNIIEQWELDRLKVHKHYADQLELSTSIQELLQPMELLRECMWHAAYTGTSFSFLSCEYTTADDLVDLADILLSHYMLKIRLPKKTDWVKKFKEYVLSYKI